MSDKYHILVVDDELTSRKLIVGIFKKRGFQASQASSGKECLELTESLEPDIIFLDVMMPGMDGFETCKKLKKNTKTMGIPVVFISGLEDKNDILKLYKAGGIDFIPKPIDAQITVAKARTTLENLELIKDKNNLLKINKLILSKLNALFKEVALEEKISTSKEELHTSSSLLSELLEKLRSDLSKAIVTLDTIE
ncbi:MAG: response regulator [Thermodesulfobacteriota bacterium]|nr:response regulator [Thermodesulfobacteriota bacterium]